MKYEEIQKVPDSTKLEGAKMCIENAFELMLSAFALSENEKFGPALNLVIIGAEEAAKAYGIYLILIGIRDKNTIDKLLRGRNPHKTRMEIIREVAQYESENNTDKIENSVHKYLQERYDIDLPNVNKNEDFFQWLKNVFAKDQNKQFLQDELVNNRLSKQSAFINEWYEGAKNLREQATYVNYHNGEWLSPNRFEKDDFIKAVAATKDVVNAVLRYIKNLEEIGIGNFKHIQEITNNFNH